LKGKRIALHRGRPWELPFQRLLDSKGLKYEDFSVLNLNPEAATAAIIAKKVDAMYTMSDAYVLEHRGVAKIIWSTESAPPDWKLRAELWGISAFVDKHPELTQLVANAFVQAAHWASLPENRDEVVKLATVSGTPASSVRRAQDNVKPYRDNWSPLFDEPLLEHYRQATRQAFDKRMVATQLDFAEMHDDRFVRAALTQLGLGTYWQPAGSSAVLSPRLRQ
jgi:sulfonate transport system substrate-binding protein